MEGHIGIALLLIALGANISCQTKDGWSCLMSACSNGHHQLARILIASGCDIEAQTKLGLTALHIAAWKGHAEMVQMLLHSGSNPMSPSHNSKTALQLAQEENRHQCVTVLTAAVAKNSEEPIYRISSLEGQLRLHQAKLTEAHHKHSADIASQQVKHEEKLADLQTELKQSMLRIERLEKSLENLQKAPTIGGVICPTPPPLQAKSQGRYRNYKRKSDGVVDMKSTSGLLDAMCSPPKEYQIDGRISQLSNSRPKSASYNDILDSVLGMDRKVSDSEVNTLLQISPSQQHSETTVARRESTERLTITALVEQSMTNPSSISAIRKELKSDSFTPKMKRKFQDQSAANSATLPSVVQDVKNGNPDVKFWVGDNLSRN